MNFGLIPMPACEQLTMGYIPSAGGNLSIGETTFFGLIVATFLAALLAISQLPSSAPSVDFQPDVSASAAFADGSCEDCPDILLLPDHQKQD